MNAISTDRAEYTPAPDIAEQLAALADQPQPLPGEEIERLQQLIERDGLALAKVDPRHVITSENVRDAATAIETLTPDYVQSVKDGMRQRPSAFLTGAGVVQIKDGQRRILAARKAGLTTVWVVVEPAPDGSDDARRAELVVEQVAANKGEPLTAEQLYRAQEELAGLDLPARDKSRALRALGVDRAGAKALTTLTASGSDLARASAASGQLDLLQAAAAIEFEHDDNAFARLVRAAEDDRFDAVIEELREEQRVNALCEAAATEYAERGFRILTSGWGSEYEGLTRREELRTSTGEPVTDAHLAPALWAVRIEHREQTIVTETGETIGSWMVDSATYGDPDREPMRGRYHASAVHTVDQLTPKYWCISPKAAGLTTTAAKAKSGSGTKNTKVSAINKEALTDTRARRAFATKWLANIAIKAKDNAEVKARKTAQHAEALRWRMILEGLTPGILFENRARETGAALLGIERESLRDGSAFAEPVKPAHLNTIAIGLGMGAMEGRMQPHEKDIRYWRIAEPGHQYADSEHMTQCKPYVELLVSLGYVPGIVDRLTLGQITMDAALAEIAAKPQIGALAA